MVIKESITTTGFTHNDEFMLTLLAFSKQKQNMQRQMVFFSFVEIFANMNQLEQPISLRF